MEINLGSDVEEFVQAKVASGQFAAASDFLRAAVLFFKEQEVAESDDLEELRREIAIGIEQIERGECAPWNVEEVLAEGRRLRDERRRDNR